MTKDQGHSSLLRALHAAGRDAGLDHEALRDLAISRWPAIDSLRKLSDAQCRTMLASLGNRKSEIPNRQSPPRPRGRPREEGTIRLATAKQRTFMRSLLERLSGPEAAHGFAQGALGGYAGLETGATWSDVEAIPKTQREATRIINAAIGELRKRGMWKEPRGLPRAVNRSGMKHSARPKFPGDG